MATVTIGTIDRLGKRTSLAIGAADAVLDASVQALVDAIAPIIRGAAPSGVVTVGNVVDPGSAVPPADFEANRGSKWLFSTQVGAENGKIYVNEIGTADGSVLPSSATDNIDLSAGVGATLKFAWDAVFRSDDGNTGELISVKQVNRALN